MFSVVSEYVDSHFVDMCAKSAPGSDVRRVFSGYHDTVTSDVSRRTRVTLNVSRVSRTQLCLVKARKPRRCLDIYTLCDRRSFGGPSPKGNKGDPPVCNVTGCLI